MSSSKALLLGFSIATALALGPACDSGDKPSMAEALAKSDKAEAERKAAEESKKAAVKAPPTLADDPSKVEHPWNIDKVRAELQMGLVLTYTVSGVDLKGKPMTDEYRVEVKGNNEDDVSIVQTLMSAADKPQAKQALSLPWDKFSPFFVVEKAETEVTGRETIEVPAGKFDCITAELKGFFGAHKTVWMPIGKPGIYAKVVDHGNVNEEADQTETVYELTAITPGA